MEFQMFYHKSVTKVDQDMFYLKGSTKEKVD